MTHSVVTEGIFCAESFLSTRQFLSAVILGCMWLRPFDFIDNNSAEKGTTARLPRDDSHY